MDTPTVIFCIDALGTDTLQHCLDNYDGEVNLEEFRRLGWGNLLSDPRLPPNLSAQFAENTTTASVYEDSQIGHGEGLGHVDTTKYELFPDGFDAAFVRALEKKIGYEFMFNEMAAGIAAIADNRLEHEKTEKLILYASKCDPVMQIAFLEDLLPEEEVKRVAEEAFTFAVKEGVLISRVIMRPYRVERYDKEISVEDLERIVTLARERATISGSVNKAYRVQWEEFARTEGRYDAVPDLVGRTLMHVARDHGVETVGVGKTCGLVKIDAWSQSFKPSRGDFVDPRIKSIYFAESQFEQSVKAALEVAIEDGKTYSTTELIERVVGTPAMKKYLRGAASKDTNYLSLQGTINAFKENSGRMIALTNLVDTDSIYGHTQNVEGTLKSLERLGLALPYVYEAMPDGTLVLFFADHNMDHRGDYGYHSAGNIQLLGFRKGGDMKGLQLHSPKTLASVGHIVAQNYGWVKEYEQQCNFVDFI